LSLEWLHQVSSALVLFECGRYCHSNCSFGPAVPWYYSSADALVPQIASSGLQRLHIIRVRTLCPSNRFIRPSAPPFYSSANAWSLESLHQAFSASILFECGRSVPRIASLGLQRLYIIRVRASVPRIALFGPAVPHIIRVRSPVPRIISFGSSTLLYYSSAGFGPSNRFLRASSTSILFECGLRSLELLSSGQQCLHIIRVWAPVPRIVFFGSTAPLNYLNAGFHPSNLFSLSRLSPLPEIWWQ
jgi:hypothetical protein